MLEHTKYIFSKHKKQVMRMEGEGKEMMIKCPMRGATSGHKIHVENLQKCVH